MKTKLEEEIEKIINNYSDEQLVDKLFYLFKNTMIKEAPKKIMKDIKTKVNSLGAFYVDSDVSKKVIKKSIETLFSNS